MGLKTIQDTNMATILIVDDDPISLEIINNILVKKDLKTATAMDGSGGIALAKANVPDLILLDIDMVDMDGIETCKHLKADDATKNIPVIFITASTDNETLKEAFEAGATDYIRKPVNQIELLARVNAALTHKELVAKAMEQERFKGVLEMAGAVCHELNQPLHASSIYSELLMMDATKADPLFDNIKKIKAQIEKIGKITKKLMRITKYETKDYVLKGKKIVDIERASSKGPTSFLT